MRVKQVFSVNALYSQKVAGAERVIPWTPFKLWLWQASLLEGNSGETVTSILWRCHHVAPVRDKPILHRFIKRCSTRTQMVPFYQSMPMFYFSFGIHPSMCLNRSCFVFTRRMYLIQSISRTSHLILSVWLSYSLLNSFDCCHILTSCSNLVCSWPGTYESIKPWVYSLFGIGSQLD